MPGTTENPQATDPGGDVVEVDLFGKRPEGYPDWSHRRREPRGLALFWMLYLLISTGTSLLPMVAKGALSGDVYRPSARVLMVLVMVGLVVLWPVLRCSQKPTRESPVLDVLRDLGVLVIPALVLLWPQAPLAGWSVRVVSAASVVVVVWAIVAGTVLMWFHAWSRGGTLGRLAVIAAGVMIAGGVPLLLAMVGELSFEDPGAAPSRGWMWSPVTGVWEVLRDRAWSGMSAVVSAQHWRTLWIQLAVSCALFVGSAFACRGGRGLVR